MMQGKTHENIKTIRPLKDGVIADFDASEKMINMFIKNIPALKKKWFPPALRMVICIPSGITEVEMRAVKESAERVNGKEVYLIHEPMAAAIGAGLPVSEATGSLVLDIGGGTTEIAVISLNGLVYSESVRIGGDRFDEAIVNYVRRNYGTLIGETTAEMIKHEIGSAYPGSEVREIQVNGRNLAEGIPRSFTLNSNEVLEALQDPLQGIVAGTRKALEQIPPELSADVAEKGMVLTGGGALLRDIDLLLQEETGLPVVIADEPMLCVARGAEMALDFIDEVTELFEE